ncbi:unnamed protein product [Rotaria sp. Silwood2]|nr:unnamed protein product [Rotaria sp. Silwood2]CAF2613997.1 unnamed protein product [Rotaria sp. Silwood2]CAF2910952.1 unnamed protein product [Rotaria sp. Silwood2]CAF3027224.1 unnamed protein product [Rotaria sp. Silwood2]CAF3924258.1 unnamed protein product [Rotaria sp. Silwood2]
MTTTLETFQSLFNGSTKNKSYRTDSGKVHTIDWNVDGSRLASGSLDKSVVIFAYDGKGSMVDRTYREHGEEINQLAWHPTVSHYVATASGDRLVKIFDTRTDRSNTTIETKGENINLAWSPDGTTLAVGNKDDLITFIDVKTSKIIREEQFRYEVNEISWDRSGSLFAVTTGHGSVVFFDAPGIQKEKDKPLEELHCLTAHTGNCICLEFDTTGKYFAVGAADASASIWDVAQLVCLNVLTRIEWAVRGLSFGCQSQLLALASEDPYIEIAKVDTGERVYALKCDAQTLAVAWHPKASVLAYVQDDDSGSVRLFGVLD